MTVLSDRTLGLLTEIGERFTRRALETMLMRANLATYDPPGFAAPKGDLLLRHLRAAEDEAIRGNDAARRALLDFVLQIVSNVGLGTPKAQLDQLYEALHDDGYQLTLDGRTFRLLPTDPSAVPLVPEITALEAELTGRGYTTALNHYQQAADGLLNQKYESANGDLRAALEDLVTRLAEDHTGYQRRPGPTPGQPRANQGGSAINHLVEQGHLPEREGGKLLQGLWDMIHTNGPHPGQSDADEARFRMQVVTATARFLLKHFPAQA